MFGLRATDVLVEPRMPDTGPTSARTDPLTSDIEPIRVEHRIQLGSWGFDVVRGIECVPRSSRMQAASMRIVRWHYRVPSQALLADGCQE